MTTSRDDCRLARARMTRAFDATLPVEECLALEEHAAGCERCGAEWGRTTALVDALQGLPEAPVGGLDLEAAARAVHARIDAMPVSAQRSPGGRSLRWTAAAAAGALVLAGAWRMAGSAPSEEGQAAAQVAVQAGIPDGTGEQAGDAQAPGALDPGPPEAGELVAAAPEAGEGQVPEADQSGDSVPAAAPEEADALPVLALPAFDPVRRAGVLAQVEERLAGALGEADPAAPGMDWVNAFAARNGDLVAAGWPLDGLLRSLVSSATEPRLRAAALRAMGPIGGRATVATIERELGDVELGPAAAQTLVELWPAGRHALARAWWRPELHVALQARLMDQPANLRRGLVQDALEAGPRGFGRSWATAPLASLLANAGEGGVRDLVLLLGHEGCDRDRVLAALEEAQPETLAAVITGFVELEIAPLPETDLLAAAGASKAPELLGWVLERAERGRHREAVADALARFGSMEALGGLVRLEASRRVEPEAFLGAFALAAERAPAELDALAQHYLRREEQDMARRLLELCATVETRACLAAGLRLCGDPLLRAPERRDVLLELGDRMGTVDLDALTELFARQKDGDGEVAAAALLVAHELDGERATGQLLESLAGELSGSRWRQVTERLQRGASRRATLYTLTNLLEPCLAARALVANSTLENL